MKLLLLVGVLLMNTWAYADEGFMGFGVGVANSAKHGPGEVKTYNLGYREDLIEGFYWQGKAGLWGLGANSEGQKSSGYGTTGLGFRVDFTPVEFHAGWSAGLITTPDSFLGGVFEFQGDLGVTLRDRHGNGIGLAYTHLSSAGIYSPNLGRDFGVLELSTRW